MIFQLFPPKNLVLLLFLQVTVLWTVNPAYAQDSKGNASAPPEDRPTLTRAINIDEASVINSIYIVGSIDNDFSQGHLINLEGEGLFRLAKDWGLDITFPQVILQQPLGQGGAALGPIGGGLRYVFAKFRNRDADSMGVFSIQAQASYWATPNDQFDGVGSNYTLQGLAGVRWGWFYVQGNYGYNGGFDSKFQDVWFANSALGYALSAHWALQVEADYSGFFIPGGLEGEWQMVPQLGFKTDGWLLEAGVAFNPSQTGTSTDFIIEKDLF